MAGNVEDQTQLRVVEALQALQDEIIGDVSLAGRLRKLLRGTATAHPRGIYLWGGVGRGKTFLMDQFYGSLNVKKKKRIYFHRMMRDIHTRLKSLEDVSDPLNRVAGGRNLPYATWGG